MVSGIPDRHANINSASCAQFWRVRLSRKQSNPGSRQYIHQYIPVPYFGQMPNPENTLPDPDPNISAGNCIEPP